MFIPLEIFAILAGLFGASIVINIIYMIIYKIDRDDRLKRRG